MKKLFFLAIPLLLFGFSNPKNTSDDVFKKNLSTTSICVKDCSNPTHYEVRVPNPPSPTSYLHIDGVLIGTVGRIFYVPKSALGFTLSTLINGNYAIYAGGTDENLQDACNQVVDFNNPIALCD